MSSTEPGPQPTWQPGDVANGHVLGEDGVWRPLPPSPPQWRQGDIVNGHVLGSGNVWRPLPYTPARRKRWYARPLGIAAIVVGCLLVLGMGSAMAGDDDPGDANFKDVPPASSPRESGAPDASSATDQEPAAATPTTKPKPKRSTKRTPKPKPKPRTYLVVDVVDGDTIDLGNGQTVRLVGIDTPERGECGSERASDNLARMVLGKRVRLAVSDEDTDRYGRLLRYVDVGTVDAGLAQIKQGYAIARYDSRDGYGFHPREPAYIKADHASKPYTCTKPRPAPMVSRGSGNNCMRGYSPCLPVVSDLDCGDINGPVRVTGSDPYRLDADGDGIGCDS